MINVFGMTTQVDGFYAIEAFVEGIILFSGLNMLKSIGTSTYSKFYNNSEKANTILTSLLLFVLLYGSILTLISILFSNHLLSVFLPGYTQKQIQLILPFFSLMSLLIVIKALIPILGNLLSVQKNFFMQNIPFIIIHLSIIASFITFTYITPDLSFVIIVYVCTSMVTVLILFISLCKGNYSVSFVNLHEMGNHISSFLKKGSPLLLVTALYSIARIVDKIIASFFDEGIITSLTLAFKINMLLSVVILPINRVLFPNFSKNYHENNHLVLQKLYDKGIAIISSIAIPLSIFFIFFSPFVIKAILISKKIAITQITTTAIFLSTYSIMTIFSSFYEINSFLYQAAQKNKIVGIAGLANFSLNILCSIIFSIMLGPIGIPVGTVVGSIGATIILYLFLPSQFGIKMSKQFILRTILLIVFSVTISILLRQFNFHDLLNIKNEIILNFMAIILMFLIYITVLFGISYHHVYKPIFRILRA